MEYRVKVGEQTYSVEADPLDESGNGIMTVDGQPRTVAVQAIPPNLVHLQVDGSAVNLFVAQTSEETWTWIDGRCRAVEDAEKTERRKARSPFDRSREVTPPTPAAVVKVLVELGQSVVEGQGVVVVSAMKMEMTLTAPYSGEVRAINTVVGAQVKPGEILVEIEPDAKEGHDE